MSFFTPAMLEARLAELAASLATTLEISHDEKFTCFPELPAELRLKIWEIFSKETAAREVKVEYRRAYKQSFSPTTGKQIYEPFFAKKPSPVPAILHICSEARAVGLPDFKLLSLSDEQGSCYINPALDLLAFCSFEELKFNILLAGNPDDENEEDAGLFTPKKMLAETKRIHVDVPRHWHLPLLDSRVFLSFKALESVTMTLSDIMGASRTKEELTQRWAEIWGEREAPKLILLWVKYMA